jgi:hypothetical protein
MDVYPGEEETLDVAVRFDDEADCYGWNNDAYFHNCAIQIGNCQGDAAS